MGIRRKLNYLLLGKWHVSMLTNMVTGGLLFAIGDAIEQSVEIRRKWIPKYDWKRTSRMATVGFFTGSVHQLFFSQLETIFPGKDIKSVWTKVFFDQAISCPVFHIQFFLGMAVMEGKSLRDGWDEFKRKFPTLFLVDLVFWTPCQLFNFLYVPLSHRTIFVNSVSVLWNIFLSYYKHYDQGPPRLKECCRQGTCSCHHNESPVLTIIRRFHKEKSESTKEE